MAACNRVRCAYRIAHAVRGRKVAMDEEGESEDEGWCIARRLSLRKDRLGRSRLQRTTLFSEYKGGHPPWSTR
jgi:hypothetical protein